MKSTCCNNWQQGPHQWLSIRLLWSQLICQYGKHLLQTRSPHVNGSPLGCCDHNSYANMESTCCNKVPHVNGFPLGYCDHHGLLWSQQPNRKKETLNRHARRMMCGQETPFSLHPCPIANQYGKASNAWQTGG
jgi:hypothetical protein